ncbi:MAG: DUF3445 domain-containing protein [Rubrivivax sp.]|nr:DUF3445 domain-containing protein [Rubrivivax sp.]
MAPGSRHQREKLAVLCAFWPQALLKDERFDPTPALDALARRAAAEHPQAFAWDGQHAEALLLGTAVHANGEVRQTAPGRFGLGDEVARCLCGLPARWRLTGLLSLAFREDFAIVDTLASTLPWLAVALPSHWAPEDRVGRRLAEVAQGPWADDTLLSQAADSAGRQDPSSDRWEQFVWTVTDHPRLHAHTDRSTRPRWADTPVERAWWRTERQTFVPLPDLKQAILTMEVDVQPLAQALAAPGRARRLHDAVADMSDAALADHGLAPVREALLACLTRWEVQPVLPADAP